MRRNLIKSGLIFVILSALLAADMVGQMTTVPCRRKAFGGTTSTRATT